MAGLIGEVSGLASAGLLRFLTGTSAVSAAGEVEQFRNNLVYDYGEILSGVNSKGELFDIRINGIDDFEFGRNLSIRTNRIQGILDAGDALALDAAAVSDRLEMMDVARVGYGLLLAAKGEITEEELNTNPAYSGLTVLSREDAFDRLNIDLSSKFRVNGVQFEYVGEEIKIKTQPGRGNAPVKRDLELDRLRSRLSDKIEATGGFGDKQEVDMTEATLNDLIFVRDVLEQNYTFVTYDFDKSLFIGSNNFSDIMPILADVPDGFFFGANLAYQIEQKLGDDVSAVAKNELFPVTINYFSSLLLGAVTGLPSQLTSEYEAHARTVLTNLYKDDGKRAGEIMDTIAPVFEEVVTNVFDAVSEIDPEADLQGIRKGLGINFKGSTYTVSKFARGY